MRSHVSIEIKHGSSARAEVYRRGHACLVRGPGLLRTRGGLPDFWLLDRGFSVAPPHARRSTRVFTEHVLPRAGSSARAEVYLSEQAEAVAEVGLLRTRGGLPLKAVSALGRKGAPPHARRSTRRPRAAVRAVVGSSARAEVYPPMAHMRRAPARLLRTRGGLPRWQVGKKGRAEAPPHARRSTWWVAVPAPVQDGSSARAEVYPHHQDQGRSHPGLLRTRGGLPWTQANGVTVFTAPPHARRSTSWRATRRVRRSGSSARAEVYPRCRWTAGTASRLLRTRGGLPG